jgi:hypothetical protein
MIHQTQAGPDGRGINRSRWAGFHNTPHEGPFHDSAKPRHAPMAKHTGRVGSNAVSLNELLILCLNQNTMPVRLCQQSIWFVDNA